MVDVLEFLFKIWDGLRQVFIFVWISFSSAIKWEFGLTTFWELVAYGLILSWGYVLLDKEYFFFVYFLVTPHGMGDLSFSIRDWTADTSVEAQSLHHWTTREVLEKEYIFGVHQLPAFKRWDVTGQLCVKETRICSYTIYKYKLKTD